MILRCVPERACRSLRFEVFQTVELREGERIPPEFAFFTFSVITISFKMAVAVMVPDEMASIPVVAARHQHLVQQLLGFSQTEAELMKSKAGKSGALFGLSVFEICRNLRFFFKFR